MSTLSSSTATPRDRNPDRLAPGSALVIGLLIASTFTVILNEMLMAVALPRVMADLGISASTAQWLTTGYMLTMAVVIPTTGFLTERFQMRSIFTWAMSLFVLGTIVAAAAPDFTVLLLGRVIQAIGTAIVMPLAFTAATTLVPPSRTGRIMALLTVAVSAAPALGPVVAGTILSIGSWRWLFVLILPIALVSLAFGNWKIRVKSDPRLVKLDIVSVGLSALGFAALVYGLATLGEGAGGHTIVAPWYMIAAGIFFVAIFVARQIQLQKTDSAQLDMRPFAIPTFAASATVAVLFMTPAIGLSALLPVVLQTSYGLSSLAAGLFIMPGGITIAIISTIVGRSYDRIGARPLLLTGGVIDASGLWFLSMQGPGAPIWLLLATFIFIVVGQALMWTPVFAASLGSLDKHLLPHGSAILNTLQQLAGAAGIAIMFSIMTAVSSKYLATVADADQAMAVGAQQAYLVGSGLVLAALLVAFLVPRKVTSVGSSIPVH